MALRGLSNKNRLLGIVFSVGDVEYEGASKVAGFITPVPGGMFELICFDNIFSKLMIRILN